jgi:histidine triad (HIT) family protein
MFRHAPVDYVCPFCLVAQGIENEQVLTCQADVVFQNDTITAFICSHQFANNHGHTLIIPNAHYENIYELPAHLMHESQELAQAIALAMKSAYGCNGVTIWQSNEPAGTQTVWHYHLHVIPRFVGDEYLHNLGNLEHTYKIMEPEQRVLYARKLKSLLNAE